MLIKNQVLKILEKNKGNNISGEKLAKELNISRTAIWKAINTLRNEGYIIKAIPHIGYSLAAQTDLISKEGISIYLNKDFNNIDIYTFKSIGSTNEEAKKLAIKGAINGTIVISEEQTRGKGRLGRNFYSPANTGIYMSIILRPDLTVKDSVLITTSASVAICNAIYKVARIDCKIKWINDIYINNKKVGGILTEASSNFENGTIDYLILGVGINFNRPKSDFPKEIKDIATSLFNNDNNDITRNRLIAEIINNILDMINKIKKYDFISDYKKRSIILNENIKFTYGNKTLYGKAIDIKNDGSLIIQQRDGQIITINSGEVTIRRINN